MSERRRIGPKVEVTMSCAGCVYEDSVSYVFQSDSGHHVYCKHPDIGGRRIADTSWRTPDWCPLRADAVRVFVATLAKTTAVQRAVKVQDDE